MLKRLLLFAVVAAAVVVVVKKVKDAREERELWQEALAAGEEGAKKLP